MVDLKIVLDKLDKIDNKQSDMNETLIRNTVSLEEHVRRSDLAEKNHNLLVSRVDVTESFQDKLKGSWKVILCLSTILGIALAIMKFI